MNNQSLKTQTLLNCMVCGFNINRQNLKKISQKNQSGLAYCVCPKCSSASLCAIYRREDQSVILGGILTDLQAEEAGELIKKGPISTNEFLEILEKLSSLS